MPPVEEVIIDVGKPVHFPYGLRSPYTRRITIDSGGKGDHTTVQDAIADAATTATWTNPVLIEFVSPNSTYYEVGNFTLTAGMTLKGINRQSTRIRGTPTLHSGARMVNLLWLPTTGSFTLIHMVNDSTTLSTVVENCYGFLGYDINATIYGLKASGTASNSNGMEFYNTKLYIANRITGTAPLAHMIMFHLEPGCTSYVHATDCLLKTSCGRDGTGVATSPELIWNQGTTVEAYVEVSGGTWQMFGAVTPRVLRSENTFHHGGDMGARVRMPEGAVFQADIVAYAGSLGSARYEGLFEKVTARKMVLGSSPVMPNVACRNDEWYNAPGMGLPTTTVLTQNVERAAPFPINGGGQTWKAVRIEVTTAAAGSVIRLGLRAMAADGRPGTMVYDWGTVDSSGTGFKTISFTAVRIPPGFYFLCAVAEGGSPTVRHVAGSGGYVPQGSTGGSFNAGYEGSHTPGALATSFTYTGLSLTTPRLALQSGG